MFGGSLLILSSLYSSPCTGSADCIFMLLSSPHLSDQIVKTKTTIASKMKKTEQNKQKPNKTK